MKKIVLLVTIIICISIFTLVNCYNQKPASIKDNNIIFDTEIILDIIYSGLPSAINDEGYLPSKSELYIDSVIPGSYTELNKDELLVVARIDSKNLSHAAGFYHAYMAVFDNSSGVLSSKIIHFRADEGDYITYRGENLSYLFFNGAVVYQGAADRYGGLYRITNDNWGKVWPEDNSFWEDNSVGIRSNGLRVLKKRIISSGEQLIPDITWDFDYYLDWLPESSSFARRDAEY